MCIMGTSKYGHDDNDIIHHQGSTLAGEYHHHLVPHLTTSSLLTHMLFIPPGIFIATTLT